MFFLITYAFVCHSNGKECFANAFEWKRMFATALEWKGIFCIRFSYEWKRMFANAYEWKKECFAFVLHTLDRINQILLLHISLSFSVSVRILCLDAPCNSLCFDLLHPNRINPTDTHRRREKTQREEEEEEEEDMGDGASRLPSSDRENLLSAPSLPDPEDPIKASTSSQYSGREVS